MSKAINSQPLETLTQQLDQGATTSVELVEDALARSKDPSGQGPRVYTQLFETQALNAARASDLLRAAGLKRSMIEGIVVAVKDLFDVAGHVTRAGSVILADQPPALHDADVVARLRAAGAIVLGTTNMTEFAYSGLGINPHYGTPLGPFDRSAGRIPGGSSSGAGVAVSDGMASVSIATDTGGSIRIPAAFCGLTGFKPTAHRISQKGLMPLSTSLDAVGPLAHRVTCCAWLDAVMRAEPISTLTPKSISSLILAKPNQIVFENIEPIVEQTFTHACEVLQQAGARIIELDVPEFSEWLSIHAGNGLATAEAWAWHQRLIATQVDRYDPRVSSRLLEGKHILASTYIDALASRKDWINRLNARIQSFDALIYPTVPIIPPLLAPLIESDEQYKLINSLVLRNTALINYLNGCSLSIPCHVPDQAPVGLMLSASAGQDDSLLQTGLACEHALNRARGI